MSGGGRRGRGRWNQQPRAAITELANLLRLRPPGWREIWLDDNDEAMVIGAFGDHSNAEYEMAMNRIKHHFMSQITMRREMVLSQFRPNVAQVQGANSLEELYDLSLTDADKFASSRRGITPSVEILEVNRIDLQALRRGLCDRIDGKFLLCRTVTPAVNGLWVETFVDDPSGENTAMLRLNNFTPPKYSKNAGKTGGKDFLDVLPKGSFVVVKNAYAVMSLFRCQPGAYLMQVTTHNPADVVILSPKKMRQLFPGLTWETAVNSRFWTAMGTTDVEIAQTLKAKGNLVFLLNRFTDAYRLYDMALDYVGEEQSDQFSALWSNKAAALIGLGCFQEALECSQKVLDKDPNHVKGIYRKVVALIGVGRGDEAVTYLTNKLAEEPSLRENGPLQKFSTQIPRPGAPLSMDVILSTKFHEYGSEYMGPVEFRRDSAAKRGVFATQDIPAGDIVVVERTFAETARRPEISLPSTPSIHQSLHELGHAEITGIIANKIALSPRLGSEIYKLWGGTEFPPLASEDPENNLVNVQRIQSVVRVHVRFCGMNCGDISPKLGLLRHSCVDVNIFVHHGPGWVVARSIRPIKKGEELVTQLINVAGSLEYRRYEFARLEMTCDCRLCQRDAKDGPREKRFFENLTTKIRSYTAQDFERSRDKVDTALGIVRLLGELRKDAPSLNPILMDSSIKTRLCENLFARQMYQEYVDIQMKIFDVSQAVNHVALAHNTAMNLVHGYLKLGNLTEAARFVREARKNGFLFHGTEASKRGLWPVEIMREMIAAGPRFMDGVIFGEI